MDHKIAKAPNIKFNSNLGDPVFQQADEQADKIEEQVKIFLSRVHPEFDYRMVVETSIFVAQHSKSVIPMYLGNLNPKWKLYDTVIEVLNNRLLQVL